MNKNVTMKVLGFAITLVVALIGTIYGLTLKAQAEKDERQNDRLNKLEAALGALPEKLEAINVNVGRFDERQKGFESLLRAHMNTR